MPIVTDVALDDARLDVFREIRGRVWPELFVGEGLLITERVLRSGHAIESVVCEDRLVTTVAALMPSDRPLYRVANGAIADLAGFKFHRGVLVAGVRRTLPSVAELIPPPGQPCTIVVAERMTDPENVGGLLRLAAAFDVSAVLLGPECADPYSRRVLRTSMAACLTMPWTRLSRNLVGELTALSQEHAVETWATVLAPEAVDLATLTDRPTRTAIVLGNEGHGLAPRLWPVCDRLITIPVSSAVDSLNVNVAAGIVVHHLRTLPVRDDPRGGNSARKARDMT